MIETKSTRFFEAPFNFVRTKMPSQSMLNSVEEITSLHHVALNQLLLGLSALDLIHLTRYFQRNEIQILNQISLY